MKHHLKVAVQTIALTFLLSAGARLASAQDSTPAPPAPDNTKVNQRDTNAAEPTADQQKENRSDREISQDVRRAIMEDKTMSTYAQNVKIISQGGQVTLKGPVRSEAEKSAIEAKAAGIVGKDKVTSQLEIKPKQ